MTGRDGAGSNEIEATLRPKRLFPALPQRRTVHGTAPNVGQDVGIISKAQPYLSTHCPTHFFLVLCDETSARCVLRKSNCWYLTLKRKVRFDLIPFFVTYSELAYSSLFKFEPDLA
jgi:hypothetical protein